MDAERYFAVVVFGGIGVVMLLAGSDLLESGRGSGDRMGGYLALLAGIASIWLAFSIVLGVTARAAEPARGTSFGVEAVATVLLGPKHTTAVASPQHGTPRLPARRVVPQRRTVASVAGAAASWYCQPGRSACSRGYPAGGTWTGMTWVGYAAAGPTARAAAGPAWRGRLVRVSAGGRSVLVRLIDWCACPDGRALDLYASAFARLAPLGQGMVRIRMEVLR